MFNSYRNFAICILIILVLIALCQLKKERISKLFTSNGDLLDPLFSIKKKGVSVSSINYYQCYLILCYTDLFSELSRESHGRAFREGGFYISGEGKDRMECVHL